MVQRYDLTEDVETGIFDITPVPEKMEGRYVLYVDYEKLEAGVAIPRQQERYECVSKLTEALLERRGWVDWHGGNDCPVTSTQRIQVKFRNGEVHTSLDKHHYEWQHFQSWDDIVAYRIV